LPVEESKSMLSVLQVSIWRILINDRQLVALWGGE